MRYLFKTIALILFFTNVHASEYSLNNTNEYSPTLSNRLSLMTGINPNPRQMTSLNSLSASYAIKRSVYWLDFMFLSSSGLFQKMTMNNTAATAQTDAQLFDVRSTHMAVGVGAMIDSSYSRILFNSDNWYETSSAYITYNTFKNSSLTSTYTGPGLITKFSVCRKLTDLVSFGANMNYLLASVKRPAETTIENSSSQSLTISYLTLGLEFVLTI